MLIHDKFINAINLYNAINLLTVQFYYSHLSQSSDNRILISQQTNTTTKRKHHISEINKMYTVLDKHHVTVPNVTITNKMHHK